MIFYLAFIAILVIISYYDIKYKKIPNQLIIILAGLAVCSFIFNGKPTLLSAVLGAVFCFIFLFVIRILSGRGLGVGDIKLMSVAGFMLGLGNVIYSLLIGTIIAGLYCIIVLKSRTKDLKDKIALGPFLSIGIAAIILFKMFRG